MYSYFSYQVLAGHITVAEYTVLFGATTLLTSILISFFDNIAQINNKNKIVDFYDEYRDIVDNQSYISKSNEIKEKSINFKKYVIKFENVSFAYPGNNKFILKEINLEITNGEKIGIVGLNGSGKTTLVKLLTRIYDPTIGRITLNDIDIRKLPYKDYIKHIGVVLQDFQLFAYSVKDNITLDKEFNNDLLKKSINESGLKEKIDSLPNGYETSVYKILDDNGVEFSGGEGQKLAFAKSIYKDADLMILDEPTSALDPIAEYDFFSNLNKIIKNKTAIFISHRLSSTKFCDKILVIDGGCIAESGNHNELIRKNGIYSKLFNGQAKFYKNIGVKI